MKMQSVAVFFKGDRDEVLLSQLEDFRKAFPDNVVYTGFCEGSMVDVYGRAGAIGKLMMRDFKEPQQFTLELPKGGKK